MQKSVNPINLQGTEKFRITFPMLLLMVPSSCTVSGFPGSKRPSSLVAQMVKNPPQRGRSEYAPWVGKIPWRRAWPPTPIFLPGESPWAEEPDGLQSMGSQRVRHDWRNKHKQRRHEKMDDLASPVVVYSGAHVHQGEKVSRMLWLGEGLSLGFCH